MIIRVFRAVVHDGREEEFERFFVGTAVPLLEAQPGMLGLSVGTPMPSSPGEFLMVTTWKDLDALRGFAGDDWEQAVIDPAERHLIREAVVQHFRGVAK